jgi:hypothetical protein
MPAGFHFEAGCSPSREEFTMTAHYFRPGRLILHIQHHPEIKATTLKHMVRAYLKGGGGPGWGTRVGLPELPTEAQEAETVRSLSALPDDTGKILSLVCADTDEPVAVTQAAHQAQVSEAGRPQPKALAIDTVSLLSAAPDWLTGGSHHQGMTGGPGDWPSPAAASEDGNGWRVHAADERLPAWEARGEEVDVAILDTAPSMHARIWAYHEFTQHPNQAHPILKELLRPDSPRMRVYPMAEADAWQIPYSVSGHRYRMSDHGLFVAGLIYSTAPRANLHLYEVLNHYGVGSWETLANGLERALKNRRKGRPFILNASLVFGFPRAEYGDRDFPLAGQSAVIDYSTRPIRDAFGWLLREANNVVMVAAAGNDSRGTRLPARYPAAFGNVIGVAAMGSGAPADASGRIPAASYSNYADKPISDGYMTLGGERGAGNGLLGPYLDDVPQRGAADDEPVDYAPNTTGWARWAGTSFAAPIVSGLVAAWWSANRAASATAAKEALHTLALRGGDKSVNDEEVLHVRQG